MRHTAQELLSGQGTPFCASVLWRMHDSCVGVRFTASVHVVMHVKDASFAVLAMSVKARSWRIAFARVPGVCVCEGHGVEVGANVRS